MSEKQKLVTITDNAPQKYIAADTEYNPETSETTYITLCMLTGRSQEQMDRIEKKLDQLLKEQTQ